MTGNRHGKRFRLLTHERMWQRWAVPCLLVVPASLVLWWYAPRIAILDTALRHLALVPALAGAVVLIYARLARRRAWIQCRAEHLRIQTPLAAIAISYGRIRGVRPSSLAQVYDPVRQRAATRSWLRPYWGRTALVLDLSGYPLHKAWLRLLLGPFHFLPHQPGLVLVVENWMALANQIDGFHAEWQARHAERRPWR